MARATHAFASADVSVTPTPRGIPPGQEPEMSKGQQRSNREAKKPKKEKPKVLATAGMGANAPYKPAAGAPSKPKR